MDHLEATGKLPADALVIVERIESAREQVVVIKNRLIGFKGIVFVTHLLDEGHELVKGACASSEVCVGEKRGTRCAHLLHRGFLVLAHAFSA